jgi:hypothetical protein
MITEYSDTHIAIGLLVKDLVQLNKNTSAYNTLIDKHIVEDNSPTKRQYMGCHKRWRAFVLQHEKQYFREIHHQERTSIKLHK